MKIIKFRGKRTDNGAWETGCAVVLRRGLSNEKWFIADKMTGFHTPVVPQTVGQFTGLHDSNGKEIYEGDVIVGEYGHLHVIRYNKRVAAYTATLLDEDLHDDLLKTECNITQRWIDESGKRVAGNVYDTPEYLKV